ncbi:acyltransferase family protein [Aestuariivirga sp.]|uniref:acyltransferase family protein n=1 Tax=Aestuariivirga sp. TaxID=2650926 RepID=UPI003BA9E251
MVVAIHARGNNWVDWGSLSEHSRSVVTLVFFLATRSGTEWVLVFFVLSGFLIGGQVIRKCKQSSFSITTFAVDRVARIYVPLLPALAWTAIVGLITGSNLKFSTFLGNVLGLQGSLTGNFGNNHPLWSLGYEIWFYVVIGAFGGLMTLRRPTSSFAYFVGFSLALGILSTLRSDFLFCLLVGVASSQRRSHSIRELALGVFLVGVGYLLIQVQSETQASVLPLWLSMLPRPEVATAIFGAGLGLTISFIASSRPQCPILLRVEQVGRPLARSSYSLYLTHYPALSLVEYVFPGRFEEVSLYSFVFYLLKILFCLGVSSVMYFFFESRTEKIKSLMFRSLNRFTTVDPIN